LSRAETKGYDGLWEPDTASRGAVGTGDVGLPGRCVPEVVQQCVASETMAIRMAMPTAAAT
jgi:hypothetical protein